jgi:hypothetical protein
VLKALGALVIAGVAVPKLVQDGRADAAWITLSAAGVICVSSVLSAVATLQHKRKKASIHDLEGCLLTLHGALHASGDANPEDEDPGVRVTLHVPRTKRGAVTLEQTCDYICNDANRAIGKGRVFSPNTGLIGEVFRLNRIGIVERLDASYESFLNDMVSRWGYTEEQARRLDGSVMSYFAVPLKSQEHGVEAIVYVDARQRGFFTKARQELVEAACIGIALFVGRRYN